MLDDSTVLITGATGLIGGAWIRLLAARARVVALVRGRDRQIPDAEVALPCNLAEPGLGLDPVVYAQLASTVTSIVNCAADTRFTLQLEEARQANVLPLIHLLAFARACCRLRSFAHISTVFVVGDRPGSFDEAPVVPGAFLSTYEQTKWEAESIALAAHDVPVSIYRLSIVNGSLVRQIVRLAKRHPFTVIPADPESRVDIVPCEWAVAALDHLFRERFAPGEIRHVCAGPEHSLSVRELIGIVQPDPLPRLVSLAEFERLLESQNGAAAEMWGMLRRFLPHLAIRQEFRNHRTRAALEAAGLTFESVAKDLRAHVDFTATRSLSG